VSLISNKSLTAAVIGSTVLAVSMLGLPSHAASSGAAPGLSARGPLAEKPDGHGLGNFDSRQLTGTALYRADKAVASGQTRSVSAFYRSLGTQGIVSMDPLTHTVRNLGRTNGFLTGRSSSPARIVAMKYVRGHLADLGLKHDDLSTFRLRQDYVDTIGVHHLSWAQSVRGVPVFGNGLKVNVTNHGQVVSVQGSPITGLARVAAAAATTAKLSASSARTTAARDVHGKPASVRVTKSRSGGDAQTVWANHDYSSKVWFLTARGLRLGWSTYVQSGGRGYQHVIDARTGSVLLRNNLSHDAAGDALVYDNYPGAKKGGKARVVNMFKRGWLTKKDTFLDGSSVVAFSDVNDDDAVENSEKTPVPGTKHHAQFPLTKFKSSESHFCKSMVCTWDPATPNSWKKNRKADATNAFYLASNFHDYLAKKPIGFTAAAGNFSASGGDPVMLNTLDGANTDSGLPDGNHIDNANMSTPPDGVPPTMQMYLWHFPGVDDSLDPFVPTSGAFDASILYHEYTHGLSNRLVVDADGNGALNTIQPGSMGEAWSDYYAMDYLVTNGFFKDTSKPGQLLVGRYVAAGLHTVRTMAIDCPPDAKNAGCTSGFDGSKGGYTYGQFPTIVGTPEVHGSGEIWGQTLWDLRTALGHNVADTLITRAMSLSPAEPSFLDMRNAILQADAIAYGQKHVPAIWKVFAARGMGYFAAATDGADAAPAEDFHRPPAPQTPRTSITGTVTDPSTGDPVSGALVQIAGLGDQFHAVTNGAGRYTIAHVFPGVYPKVVASAGGYLPDTEAVDATTDDDADFSVIRDWAASTGGAQIVDFNGPDFSPACGPDDAIDTNEGLGWGSATGVAGEPTNTFIPKFIVVDMKQPIDIDQFLVNPSNTCGDAGSASTGDFRIETSPDGVTYTEAASGTFTADNRGQLNEVDPSAASTGVRFVKFWILGNQTPDFDTNCPDGNFSGCQFTDMTELAVVGSPAS
jgi:hypothetical protein